MPRPTNTRKTPKNPRILQKAQSFFWVCSFVALFLTPLFAELAFAGTNVGVSYQGRIVRPSGEAVNAGVVAFSLRVFDPTNNCLLWSEVQNVNMAGTGGAFSLVVGAGTRTDGGAHTLKQVFTNAGTLSSLTCTSGTTYAPTANEDRNLSVTFNDGGTVVALSTMAIKSAPFALQADQVSGYGILNLAKISGAGSATTFTPFQYDFLAALAAPASASSTPCAANDILKFVGGVWTCAADATGGAPGDASYAAKGIVQFDTDADTSGITVASGVARINTGLTANKIPQFNASGYLGVGIDASSRLDVNGAITQRGMAAPAVSAAGTGRIYFDSTSNHFYYSENGGGYTQLSAATGALSSVSSISNAAGDITLAPITTTGAVVINSGTPSVGSASGALVVTGGIGASGSIYTGGSINAGTTMTAATSIYSPQLYGSAAASGSIKIDGTSHATKGNVLLASAGGDVVIGTTSSSRRLTVSTASGSAWGSSQVRLQENGLNGFDLWAGSTFQIGNGGTSRFLIDGGSGNVGIATTTPVEKLEVAGNLRVSSTGPGISSFATVTSNLAPAAVSVTVDSTAGYPSSGLIWLGYEAMSYTGKTATTFTGLTRGLLGTTATDVYAGSVVHLAPLSITSNGSAALTVFHDGGILGAGSYNWGRNSVALGGAGVVSNNAFAFGTNSWVDAGDDSLAIGRHAFVYGTGSQAVGTEVSAFGDNAMALGHGVKVGVEYGQGNGFGNNSLGFGLGNPAGAVPKITGNKSVGFFMGDQSGVNISGDNIFAILGGSVGIGVAAPAAKLEVAGGVKLANDVTPCTATNEGTIRYVGGALSLCNGTSWIGIQTTGASSFGAALYDTPGTYSWTVPATVTSVAVVVVGGGGGGSTTNGSGNNGAGGGGALCYGNNLTVTPGATITVVVGSGGAADTDGSVSSFDGFTLSAPGGFKGVGGSGGAGGTGGSATNGACWSGGAGGSFVGSGSNYSAGGGGAAGYSGNGGAGGNSSGSSLPSNQTAGSGGGGGGGGGAADAANAGSGGGGGGGGVYPFGEFASGAAGASATGGGNGQTPGGGGSLGLAGTLWTVTPSGKGGDFGGGGAGRNNVGTIGGAGGRGVVRIIWGVGRSFPSSAN